MRCWSCGTVTKVTPPEKDAIRVECSSCGKDLGFLQPRPKPVAPPLLPKAGPTPSIPLAPDQADGKRVTDGSGYFGPAFILITGIAFFGIAGYCLVQADRVVSAFTRTEGKLVHKEWQQTGRSGGVYGKIEFVANDGNTYHADVGGMMGVQLGERFHVLYNPENPADNRTDNFATLYGFASAAGGLGLILLIAGVLGVYRKSADNAKWEADSAEELARHGSRFPHVCAGCAEGKPSGTWRVCGPTTTVKGPAATVHNTPFVEVPICSKCLRNFYTIYAITWGLSAVIGVAAFCLIIFQDGDFKTLGAWAILAGIFGFLIRAIGQVCTGSMLSLGKLDPERNVVAFTNADYQQLYDKHISTAASAANHPLDLASFLKGNAIDD